MSRMTRRIMKTWQECVTYYSTLACGEHERRCAVPGHARGSPRWARGPRGHDPQGPRASHRRGLPLVHFSAQPDAFCHCDPAITQLIPQVELMLSRTVAECKRLPLVHASARPEPFLSLEVRKRSTYPTRSAQTKPKRGRV
jgi:hypothetical protein